jgi:4-diphosphocytidyl-2-C-methyl-D-erythritol kinase
MSTQGRSEQAYAKVNLFLHVVGRRPDGYHFIDSLVVFSGIGDVVQATSDAPGGASGDTECLDLTIAGDFAAQLQPDPDNLVLRAARALAAATGQPPRATLHLEKRLPVASGIGGGSADAAAALRLLVRLWDIAIAPADLRDIAATLGADVPVCLASQPARMGGIGEVLSAAPVLPRFGMLLVNPGVGVSTPAVFRARSGPFSPPSVLPSGWADAHAMAADLALCSNDLEAPALSLCPAIAEILAALRAHPGCLLARMSGSGATCFGLFAGDAEAEAAARHLARPGWWCGSGVRA